MSSALITSYPSPEKSPSPARPVECDCGAPVERQGLCGDCASLCDLQTATNLLKPSGGAWPQDPSSDQWKFFAAIAEAFHEVEKLLCCFQDEKTGCNADKTLCYWEEALGIGCEAQCGGDTFYERPETLEERQALVCALIKARGGASCQFFEDMAAELGWVVRKKDPEPIPMLVAGCGVAGEPAAFVREVDQTATMVAGISVPYDPGSDVVIDLCRGECCDVVEEESAPEEIEPDPCQEPFGGYEAGIYRLAVPGVDKSCFEVIDCCPTWTTIWEVDLCASIACNPPTVAQVCDPGLLCSAPAGWLQAWDCERVPDLSGNYGSACDDPKALIQLGCFVPSDCEPLGPACYGLGCDTYSGAFHPYEGEARSYSGRLGCGLVPKAWETHRDCGMDDLCGLMTAGDTLYGPISYTAPRALGEGTQAGVFEAWIDCEPLLACQNEPEGLDYQLGRNTEAGCLIAHDKTGWQRRPACLDDLVPDPESRLLGLGCNLEAGLSAHGDQGFENFTWRGIASWKRVEQLFDRFRPCHTVFEYEAV